MAATQWIIQTSPETADEIAETFDIIATLPDAVRRDRELSASIAAKADRALRGTPTQIFITSREAGLYNEMAEALHINAPARPLTQ